MAEVIAYSWDEEIAAADSRAYFEQRIFVLSPFSPFATAALLFILLVTLFVLAATVDHLPLVSRHADGFHISSFFKVSSTLALMLCSALFIQRYTRLKDRDDRDAFAAVLKPETLQRRNLVALTPADARLGVFTVAGVVLGLALSWPLFAANMLSVPHPAYATLAWFVLVNTTLFTAFARGVELSRSGSRGAANAIDEDLVVDLLRIDKLAVWGRSAARFALIWFTVSAVSCLFFVDSGLNLITLTMLGVLLALGAWVFIRPMERVHRKIRATKFAELERIRSEIDDVRLQAATSADASMRLQGLLAYEARISEAQEWPFDQTTLFRFAASALILTVPWFGQAIAGYAIEHLAH